MFLMSIGRELQSLGAHDEKDMSLFGTKEFNHLSFKSCKSNQIKSNLLLIKLTLNVSLINIKLTLNV
jgi:hypothetical protein